MVKQGWENPGCKKRYKVPLSKSYSPSGILICIPYLQTTVLMWTDPIRLPIQSAAHPVLEDKIL